MLNTQRPTRTSIRSAKCLQQTNDAVDCSANTWRHQSRVTRTRFSGDAQRVHIVPELVGDPMKVKTLADRLMERHTIYLRPINYPTVARGTECIRIAPGSCHTSAMVGALVNALEQEWRELGLAREEPALAA